MEGAPHYSFSPSSTHMNSYEKAIYNIGSVLSRYDNHGLIPTWGFGAKKDSMVLHCFPCGDEVAVKGVQGVLNAYRQVFRTSLTMSYPTDLTEVINAASRYAQHEQVRFASKLLRCYLINAMVLLTCIIQVMAEQDGDLSYTILFILTAGAITNAEETKQVLASASDSPLSVVIVGIGDHDFSHMEYLDEHSPDEGGRDITTFVRSDVHQHSSSLTEALLDQFPHQLVDFFIQRGIMPGQAVGIDEATVEVMGADDDDRTVNFLC